MKFKKLKSNHYLNVNINRYKINWIKPSASKLQTNVKAFLFNYWRGCFVLEEFKIPGSRLRCDFLNLNKKIAIEVHGGQHFEFNKFFHGNLTNWTNSFKRDLDKYNWLIENEFQVIELIEEDVNQLSVDYIQKKFGIFIA